MNIQAAMYGMRKLTFLADSATDSDVEEFVALVGKDGVQIGKKTELGKLVGLVVQRDLVRGGNWAGSLSISNNRGIERHIVVAMTPYARQLRNPLFVSADFTGDDVINHILGAYEFPGIIVPGDREGEVFRQRFPGHATKYGVQTQSQGDIATSIGIGRSWLDL